jgi:predicted nucleic acid-binding protein
MKRYWDTSALVDALHDSRLEALLMEPDQWTRPHALAEAFSTLTGGRLGFRYLPDDAAALLAELCQGLKYVELDAAETMLALREAQERGVRGGRIHDWLHARAAAKAKVQVLLTDNLSDFAGLEADFQLAAP